MQLIDGKKLAKEILEQLDEKIHRHEKKPGLAFILVGEDKPSQTYVRMKKKACEKIGIRSFVIELPQEVTEEKLLQEINRLNQDATIDAILLQLPLPKQIDEKKMMSSIDPKKDVDGFHPMNVGKMFLGDLSAYLPCTPQGIKKMLTYYNIPINGSHVVIMGRSNIVGKPLAGMLMQKFPDCNATVTVVHSQTKNLSQITHSADILVVAIGKPQFVKKDMVRKGAVVIDVGINYIEENGKTIIVGDVYFDQVAKNCSYISPVPGGVGPMTIAFLLSNTVNIFYRNNPSLL